MAHAIVLNDEQFDRLEAAAALYRRSAKQVIADLIAGLPVPKLAISAEEYDARWTDFMQLVGSIQHGAPLNNEEIDEMIGEEAAATHAADSGSADASHPLA